MGFLGLATTIDVPIYIYINLKFDSV